MSAVNGLKVGISSVNEGRSRLLAPLFLRVYGEERASLYV
jgi:hypothetical protein